MFALVGLISLFISLVVGYVVSYAVTLAAAPQYMPFWWVALIFGVFGFLMNICSAITRE